MRTFFQSYRSVPLLLCVLCIILTSTLRGADHPLAYLISGSIWSLLVAAAASLLEPGRLWFRTFIALAMLILVNNAVQDVVVGNVLLVTVRHLTIIAIHLLTLGLLLRHAFGRSEAPAFDRIWGNLYVIILDHQPEAIVETATAEPVSEKHVIYYSLVTLTTQGYGDIVPKSSPARLAAALEGTVGTLYLAALIAFLIGMVKPEEQAG